MTKDEPLPALDRTLYVVATPIGNLRDITLRALDVLRQVDIVAAEDTRVTRSLATHYGISATLVSLHEHNERRRASEIISWLAKGKRVALVSDAGTPAISDPGAELVRAVAEAGYAIVPVPGPSALVAAMSASGIRASQWMFCGFLPASAAARTKALERMRTYPCALVFYEAPHRVAATIDALAAVLGEERALVVAREITKRFESIHRCRLGDAAAWLAEDDNRRKGEFVLIVEAPEIAEDSDDNAHDATLAALLEELPLAQAVRIAVSITGVPRNRLYGRALAIKNGLDLSRKGSAKQTP
jgi:16S rRNA (cytidine1402-2'-O)-methyltransferase